MVNFPTTVPHMALRMASPHRDPKTHVFFLKERPPSDIAAKVRGRTVVLPLDDDFRTVKIGHHVEMSLRTKDAPLAKARFSAAHAALMRHWDSVRSGPRRLSHKEAVALAGDLYRESVAVMEDPAGSSRLLSSVDEVRTFGDRLGGLPSPARLEAVLSAAVKMHGIGALALLPDDAGLPKATKDRLAETLFADAVDAALARRGLAVDADSRAMLVKEFRRATMLSADRIIQQVDGDYSPDPNERHGAPVLAPAGGGVGETHDTFGAVVDGERVECVSADHAVPVLSVS